MTPAEKIAKLREARALIVKGWTRGTLERDGRYCAVGAIRMVTSGDPWRADTVADMLHVLVQRETGGPMLHVFNDRQTTKRPVLDLIDRTIARLEAEVAR